MNVIKRATCAGVGALAFAALAAPAAGQSIRAERAQPSSGSPTAFQAGQVEAQETISCSSIMRVYLTQRGAAVVCRQGNQQARILAVDESKFPGGTDTAMAFLLRAQAGHAARDGTVLHVRYRAPTAKTRLICDLTHNPSNVACAEVVSLRI